MFPWLPYLDRRSGEELSDHYFTIPVFKGNASNPQDAMFYSLGVNDEDTLVSVRHGDDIAAAGGIKSIHLFLDDSTSYQNTSGQDAYALIIIVARGGGTTERDFKVYSSPNNDSKTSATELWDFTVAARLNANNERLTSPLLKIQNNEYLVIENNTVGSTNTIDVSDIFGIIVERG